MCASFHPLRLQAPVFLFIELLHGLLNHTGDASQVPPPPGGEEAAAETTTEMVERLSKESEADLGGQSGDKKGV